MAFGLWWRRMKWVRSRLQVSGSLQMRIDQCWPFADQYPLRVGLNATKCNGTLRPTTESRDGLLHYCKGFPWNALCSFKAIRRIRRSLERNAKRRRRAVLRLPPDYNIVRCERWRGRNMKKTQWISISTLFSDKRHRLKNIALEDLICLIRYVKLICSALALILLARFLFLESMNSICAVVHSSVEWDMSFDLVYQDDTTWARSRQSIRKAPSPQTDGKRDLILCKCARNKLDQERPKPAV